MDQVGQEEQQLEQQWEDVPTLPAARQSSSETESDDDEIDGDPADDAWPRQRRDQFQMDSASDKFKMDGASLGKWKQMHEAGMITAQEYDELTQLVTRANAEEGAGGEA